MAHGLKEFGVEVKGKTALDVGASTGGFTMCLLKNGAAKVYAVDVGYGQLAWELRNDARVVVKERTNIRYVTREEIPDKLELATIDVSFISIAKVLVKAYELLEPEGEVIGLIKPQFEVGKGKVGKGGIVREADKHVEVIAGVIGASEALGFGVRGVVHSPIKGAKGNIEYLMHLAKGQASREVGVEKIVAAAHKELNR